MEEYDFIYLWFKLGNLQNSVVLSLEERLTDIRQILHISEKEAVERGFMSAENANHLYNQKNHVNAFREKLYLSGIQFVHHHSPGYPPKLHNIPDKPYGLFIKGNIPSENPGVAIVGARDATEYGLQMSYKLSKELSGYGIDVISGMARGIDNSAHKGALAFGGKTYAVLGCGVDVCYPRENIETYTKILESGGGIISEYLPDTKPLAWQFPMRNRIISGLSDVVILAEAKEKSGSLITVDQALEQGREVFVLPGRVTDTLSTGCNNLIKSGANILTDVSDVVEYFQNIYHINVKKNVKNKIMLASEEKIVYSVLDLLPKSLSEIVTQLDMDTACVMNILLRLELLGIVKETMKNYYVKVIE